ncbi:MAG TPA: Ig-like domain-containing protein, partial [Spirochaetota bacterium]|nr:Ig-like domain-containing protein [Spirochaetota bacterium]
MKKLFFLILGCCIILSCSDSFIENYKTELLKKRAEGKTFALVTGTTIISFTEFDPLGGTEQPGIFKAKLSAPPESDVVLDLTKADQLCTTPGIEETLQFNPTTLVFTPENYNQEQEVEITVSDNMLVNETRGHRVILPPLESSDPLYNGVETPTLYVTVFEDDTRPIAYPVTPYIGQINVPEHQAIIVTFNREMDEGSIHENSFKVTNERGEIVSGYMWVGSDKKTAYFTPKQYLLNGSLYTVDINKSIKDTYGNELISGLSWEFKARLLNLTLTKSCDTNGTALGVAVVGNYAYVADG